MKRLLRLLRIASIGLRFGLHEFVPPGRVRWLLALAGTKRSEPRGERLRGALEALAAQARPRSARRSVRSGEATRQRSSSVVVRS